MRFSDVFSGSRLLCLKGKTLTKEAVFSFLFHQYTHFVTIKQLEVLIWIDYEKVKQHLRSQALTWCSSSM